MMVQTGSRRYRRAHDGTDGLMMVWTNTDHTDRLITIGIYNHTDSQPYRQTHNHTDRLMTVQLAS